MQLGHLIKWTIICTVTSSVLIVMAFKAAGVEPGGWSGGIGAGVGVICAQIIAAKTSKRTDVDASE